MSSDFFESLYLKSLIFERNFLNKIYQIRKSFLHQIIIISINIIKLFMLPWSFKNYENNLWNQLKQNKK